MRFIGMWRRTLFWAHRLYPVLILIGIACVLFHIADHSAALSFSMRNDDARLQRMVDAGRSPTVEDVETLNIRLRAAVDGISDSANAMRWLFTAGVFGYLLLSRDSWRFKAFAFGLIVITMFAQTFFYPIY